MSNGNESAQSRKSLRHTRGTNADGQTPDLSDPEPIHPERRSRRAADAPVDAASTHPVERVSQTRARDREALRAYRALAEQRPPAEAVPEPSRRQRRVQQLGASTPSHQTLPPTAAETAPEVDRPVAGLGPVREGGRRDRRRRMDGPTDRAEGNAAKPTGQAAGPEDDSAAVPVDQMSVQQALAAREAIVQQAQEQVAQMETVNDDDPFTVDLEILAQQKALAERAAVLNSRAQKMQQLAQANEQWKPSANDPTTAHNLSIVSPKEFIRVPGVPHEVHSAGPTAPTSDAAVPIGARTAHGLEPLDAMTAGLARVKRLQLLQYSIVSLGALALVTGIMMISGVFN
ncbi:hypothetical protein [Arthrobacter flavus]|uniref:Uncharacterized protein n=1 Tax=Arthrobacter flavus TaxID=95172 RepID=A0ABW4QBH7_9MICC